MISTPNPSVAWTRLRRAPQLHVSCRKVTEKIKDRGFVASEAFIGDAGFRHRLNDKLPDASKLKDADSRPDPSEYKIVYEIATNRNLPGELPFFSKVTLKNALKQLKTLNFNVSLSAIQVDPSLEVKKKYKPKKDKKAK
ncbi:TIGR04141 family sporadically distributed protein [Acidithiobacillus ferrivorans]|uniref:TIGR04141 family sporadically distributed protein n=1 Tax=Acidithiobacillus ferrivorans TaxID=160808 RepID=UPI00020D227B|nr:TIGR04141 family sporadically distributed protein [Acidithiobacillus ferrivorans]